MKTIAMVALMVMMLFQVGCLKTLDPKKEAIAAAKKYAGSLISSTTANPLDGYQKESTYTDSTGATVIPPITEHEVLRKNTTVNLGNTTSVSEKNEEDAASLLP